MCHPRHPIYIILPSLEVMPRVPIALHLPIAHIDNITRLIAICNDAYKFVANPYSYLQEFAVDNKTIVTSHSEAARKLHGWRKDFDRVLKGLLSLLMNRIAHGILVSARLLRG